MPDGSRSGAGDSTVAIRACHFVSSLSSIARCGWTRGDSDCQCQDRRARFSSRAFDVNFGELIFPDRINYPRPQKIDPFDGIHEVQSDRCVSVSTLVLGRFRLSRIVNPLFSAIFRHKNRFLVKNRFFLYVRNHFFSMNHVTRFTIFLNRPSTSLHAA